MIQPTDPPALPAGLPGADRDPVLVLGGNGTLGRQIVAELRRAQVPVRIGTSRSTTTGDEVHANLATGEGLTTAVAGVQAVIHCATNAKDVDNVDISGTSRLCAALEQTNPQARLVYVSILGCWDNPLPYYRAKSAAEGIINRSGRPATIVRATQFHDLVAKVAGARLGPLALGVRGVSFASCDTAWVATKVVDVALADEFSSVPTELAGPEVLSLREISVLTAHVRGQSTPHAITLPALGRTLRAFAAGSNLPGPNAIRGGSTYAAWLAAQQQ